MIYERNSLFLHLHYVHLHTIIFFVQELIKMGMAIFKWNVLIGEVLLGKKNKNKTATTTKTQQPLKSFKFITDTELGKKKW